jgi:hypothetical protein
VIGARSVSEACGMCTRGVAAGAGGTRACAMLDDVACARRAPRAVRRVLSKTNTIATELRTTSSARELPASARPAPAPANAGRRTDRTPHTQRSTAAETTRQSSSSGCRRRHEGQCWSRACSTLSAAPSVRRVFECSESRECAVECGECVHCVSRDGGPSRSVGQRSSSRGCLGACTS